MELELRHLRALVAIAEAESISRAATQLRVPQPSLTAQLRRIEDTVGGKLFDRTPRGVQETALGRYVVGRARGVLAAAAHLGAGPLPSVTGGVPVRVGAFPGAPLAGLTQRLAALPGVGEVSSLTEWSSALFVQLLAAGQLDVALVREFPGFTLPWAPGVTGRTLVDVEPVHVMVAAGHPAALRAEIDLAELAAEEWIGRPPGEDGADALFREACAAAGFSPVVNHYTSDTLATARLVSTGRYVALASPGLPAPGTAVRPLVGMPLWKRVLLAWSQDGPLADRIDTVAQLAAAAYRDG